ncbi:MAG: rhomboid family intramembrane serine protease [Cyanobacteria bacterium P01_F01_bin.150]
MVPLKDENPVYSTPYITYGLIALNIAVFVHQLSLPPEGLELFVRQWGVLPTRITANLGQQSSDAVWITLFSSQFLHGSWLHLGGNMLYLWIFGNNIEDKLGAAKYLVFYLLCGVLAAFSQWFFFQNSDIPMIGASGAIAGVMGAYLVRFPKTQIILWFLFTTLRLPAFLFLGFWFAQQALSSIFSTLSMPAMGGIAYWAHAGGFLFGAWLGPVFGLMDDLPPQRR